METRFPISKDREHVMLSFTWYDAFRASKRTEQYSIHFEKAAVMFNIGATLTQQALACDRTQDQGMKDAAKRFQVHAFCRYACTEATSVSKACSSKACCIKQSQVNESAYACIKADMHVLHKLSIVNRDLKCLAQTAYLSSQMQHTCIKSSDSSFSAYSSQQAFSNSHITTDNDTASYMHCSCNKHLQSCRVGKDQASKLCVFCNSKLCNLLQSTQSLCLKCGCHIIMQEAAGAFANLRDVASLRVEQPRPVDISPECATMLERLCLAQAQECIFEKARADGKSPAILARYDLARSDSTFIYLGVIQLVCVQLHRTPSCATGVNINT